MHKTLAPLLLVLGLTPANAQIISARLPIKLPTPLGNIAPVIMPGVSVIPMSLPTINAEIAFPVRIPTLIERSYPISLPARPVPVNGQVILPGVPSPLPLPVVIAVAARPLGAGNAFDGRRESARTNAKFF